MMKTVSRLLQFFWMTALVAWFSVAAAQDNINSTVQVGQVNINRTSQCGDDNQNSTFQEGRVNINTTNQGCPHRGREARSSGRSGKAGARRDSHKPARTADARRAHPAERRASIQ